MVAIIPGALRGKIYKYGLSGKRYDEVQHGDDSHENKLGAVYHCNACTPYISHSLEESKYARDADVFSRG